MPEAEGFVNLAPRLSYCRSFGSFLEFLEARLEGLRGLRQGLEEMERSPRRPGAERLQSRIPAMPPRWPQPRRSAPGSVSENKALRFRPKVKVHHQRVFFFFLSGIQER